MLALFEGASLWHDLFVPDVSVIEKIIRPILVYIFLVVALRIFGKRELAQINPFDLVVLLSLANTVQNAIIGNDNSLIGGCIGALSLLTINYIVVRFLFRHRRWDQILEGEPTKLIINGKINQKGLAEELISKSELLSVAHRQGFGSLDEIENCTLEPGGVFYIEGKVPTADVRRHNELLAQLSALQKQIEEIKGKYAQTETQHG
jgi:uncharacterized membrane protein YcaP (DUF421 family)